jgi:uncharacterized protein YjiS (DUF1127 family)
VVAGISVALGALQRWHDVRRTEQTLRGLDPQILRDIGIDGHQVPAIVREQTINTRTVVATNSAALRLVPSGKPRQVDCCPDKAA